MLPMAPIYDVFYQYKPADEQDHENYTQPVEVIFNKMLHRLSPEIDTAGHQKEAGAAAQSRYQNKGLERNLEGAC